MTRNERHEIIHELHEIEELERQAHRIWDHVEGNLMYGNLSRERKEEFHRQTGDAVRKHSEAMDRLEAVRKRMGEIARREIAPTLN